MTLFEVPVPPSMGLEVENFFSFSEDLFMPMNRGLCDDFYLIEIFLVRR